MNDAQWLWSQLNVVEDENEEIERLKLIVEDLYYIIDPRRYFEYKKANVIKSNIKFEKLTQKDYDAILKDAAKYTEIIPNKPTAQQQKYDEIY